MGNLSNSQIERFAVASVRNEAIRPGSNLIPNILEGDKGISFDGELNVFIDSSERVESFIGKVPVQVKGKEVKYFTSGNRKLNLHLKHFQNFYKINGILLLVVEVKDDGSTKIFYKQLLLKEVSNILEFYGKKKKQGSKNVELRPLEETNLYVVCRKFLYEQKNQAAILIENNLFTNNSYHDYNLTSLTFDPAHKATNNIFDHDFMIYGVNGNLKIPLHVGRIYSLATTNTEFFTLDGETYTFKVTTTNHERSITRLFEEVFELTYDKFTHKIDMRITQFHTLTSQFKVLPFIENFLIGHSLALPEGILDVGTIDVQQYIATISERYASMQEIQKVFMELNIPEDTIIKQTEPLQDITESLLLISKALLHNDLVNLKIENTQMPHLVNYKIGDFTLVLFYNPKAPKKLVNAFSPDLLKHDLQIKSEQDEVFYPHSFYSRLSIDSLVYGANINYQVIRTSFDQIDPFLNSTVMGETIYFCLQCIKAYDISKKPDLLELANYIFNKHIKSEIHSESSKKDVIVSLNQVQIRIRKFGTLHEEEVEHLVDIKARFSFKNHIEFHFCCNVLLGSKKEAEYSFSKMDKSMQEFYKTLPIYFLFSKL